MLAGLPVKLFNGLSGTMGKADLCANVALHGTPVHELWVPHRGVENFSALLALDPGGVEDRVARVLDGVPEPPCSP